MMAIAPTPMLKQQRGGRDFFIDTPRPRTLQCVYNFSSSMSAGKVNNMGRKSARLAAKKIVFNSIPKAFKAPIGGHPKKTK